MPGMETHIPVLFLDLSGMFTRTFTKCKNSSFGCCLKTRIANIIFFLSIPFFVSTLADDFSSQENLESPEAGGWDAMLSGEDEDDFFDLQIVKHYDGEVRDADLGHKVMLKMCKQRPMIPAHVVCERIYSALPAGDVI